MADTTANFDIATLTSDQFVNRSCIIYGKSGSGKSHIIKHILYLLRGQIPTTIVFSLSEKNNSAYSRAMVPRCLVHDNVTEETIHYIAHRQTKARAIYEVATDLKVLDDLFRRVANDAQITIRDQMQAVYNDISAQKVIDEATETTYRTKMIAFYERAIEPHMRELRAATTLTEKEQFALKWFRFNPKITIVFDDCSTDLSKFKACADVLEQIFQGRHFFCTTIIALHSEAMVLPAMRGNVSLSFFTDPQIARQWAMRTSNGFPKEKRDVLTRYADRILVNQPPNTKMMFANDRPFLIEIPAHGDFSAVSADIREYCARITKKEKSGLEPWMKQL